MALIFCSLLLIVVAGYSWAAYAIVRRSVVTAAEQRLSAVVDQFVTSLQTSARKTDSTMRAAADNAVIRAYLKDRRANREAALVTELRKGTPKTDTAVTTIVLLDAKRQRAFTSVLRKGGSDVTVDSAELTLVAGADGYSLGRLHVHGDSIFYGTLAAVREGPSVLGYLIHWRRLIPNASSRDQLNRLIGEGAGLYLGSEGAWTDLVKPVAGPPIPVVPGKLLEYERPGTGGLLAFGRPINRTPWTFLLEFPRSVVYRPVEGFQRRLGLIALIVVLLGLAATVAFSRTITGPLAELSEAAEDMAAGDYSRHVTVRRKDEVARLAENFNLMMDRVRDSTTTLEDRVRERTRELQERNDDLEAFGYSISHDLRAPLRAMQGFSQIILEDYGDKLDDKGRQHAGRIVTAAKRMDELIRDLLAYSRLSRTNLETAPVSLENVVKEAMAQLEAEMQKAGAHVQVTEPLPSVRGHLSTLSQVVANLLGNSVKFVRPGLAPEVRVRAEARNGHVRLWVEDNGIGIRAEHQQRIFNVFERLHTNDQYPGTGIGLAIVKKGMERMGGSAGVESVFENGSRFWIELPRAEGGS